jgi:uncharacterized damage-inducible protein DinB
MSIAAALLPEFDFEMAHTRTVLALVPDAHGEWKPHEKSFTLSSLAMHLANLAVWGELTITRDEFDLAADAPPRAPFTTTAALVASYDDGVARMRIALASSSDDAMGAMWALKRGSVTLFSMPRLAVFRSSVLNHMIHHRGQMTVYLRLLNVPLPDLYGPTADTKRG